MPSMKRKPGLSGMNGGECIFDTGEEKRRREDNGEKQIKKKWQAGKRFPPAVFMNGYFCRYVKNKINMEDLQRLYPIGIQTFFKIREGNFLYIDKTEYVYRMTH